MMMFNRLLRLWDGVRTGKFSSAYDQMKIINLKKKKNSTSYMCIFIYFRRIRVCVYLFILIES